MIGPDPGWSPAAENGSPREAGVIIVADPILLRSRDAAALLALSLRSFQRLVSRGVIPGPIKMGMGKLERWRLEDIQAWAAGGCRSTTTFPRPRPTRKRGASS